jgi:hypothetical protein
MLFKGGDGRWVFVAGLSRRRGKNRAERGGGVAIPGEGIALEPAWNGASEAIGPWNSDEIARFAHGLSGRLMQCDKSVTGEDFLEFVHELFTGDFWSRLLAGG